jgi:flagellar motor switch protein FliG
LRRIFRKAGTESFIRCLKGCSEEITQKFYGKLGPSITSLITTRLKTFVAAGDMSEAELKIMQAIEGLSTKGLIPPLEQVKTVQ